MIIITRTYETNNPSGGRRISNVTRKVFRDDDIDGVQNFLDERDSTKGYEWYNLQFSYFKV